MTAIDNEQSSTTKPKGNVRWWPKDPAQGWLVEMATARGWVMVRRPGCMPFVMSVRDWDALPSEEINDA